jgi:HK97 family phage major capsid protein
MTIDEIMNRQGEIEQRKKEIDAELETPEADLDALGEEARKLAEESEQLKNQLSELKQAAKEAEEARKAVENGAGETKENMQEEKTMTLEELRKSKEYVDAYADYLKSAIRGNADDREVRALLTTNATAATGYVPVPTLVDDIVRTAWEKEDILARVKKTGFKGNVKVAFELSADGAYIHSEGSTAPTEESLTLGIVEIKPENIKKWITISDEMMETTGEGFVAYVYNELAYQVMKKFSYEVIGKIASCAYTTNQSGAVGIPKVKKDPAILTIATAAANLCDEAQNVCVVMNPLTKVAFLEAYAAGNFAVDPFAGLPVVFSGKLPAITACSENDVYAIVGDLGAVQANFPAGEGLKLINDPYSLAEKDLVKVVGRVYAGYEVVAPGRLVRLTKEAAAVTT